MNTKNHVKNASRKIRILLPLPFGSSDRASFFMVSQSAFTADIHLHGKLPGNHRCPSEHARKPDAGYAHRRREQKGRNNPDGDLGKRRQQPNLHFPDAAEVSLKPVGHTGLFCAVKEVIPVEMFLPGSRSISSIFLTALNAAAAETPRAFTLLWIIRFPMAGRTAAGRSCRRRTVFFLPAND